MKQELIVKANEILEQPLYKTSIELKIFSKIILEIRKNPEADVIYLNKKNLLKEMGCDLNSYGELKKVAERMFRPIDINKGKGDFILRVMFIEINASLGSQILFEVSPKMKPYFLDLTKNFTQYYFENIARLKSSFSIRIYEFLKQYESIGKRKETVEYLRYFLNIDDGKYKLYSDFKRKAILVAQRELKEKTDICFEFEEIKTGRKVTEINFIILQNKKVLVENGVGKLGQDALNPEQERLKAELMECGIAEKVVVELVQVVPSEQIANNIAYSKKEYETGKVSKNFAGYLLDAIKNNYAGNISLFEEAEKKKKAEEARKKRRDAEKKELTSQFSRDFAKQEREAFVASLDEDQQQALLDEILEEVELDEFIYSKIKKAGLKSPLAYMSIIGRIEGFAEKKEAFIAEGLQKAGF